MNGIVYAAAYQFFFAVAVGVDKTGRSRSRNRKPVYGYKLGRIRIDSVAAAGN